MSSARNTTAATPGSARVPNIDFMKRKSAAGIFSGTLVLISLLSLLFKGLVFGLDFTSGIAIRLDFITPVQPSEVAADLRELGVENAQVVNFGSDHEIRIVLQVDETLSNDQAVMAVETGERLAAQLAELSGRQVILSGSDFVSAKAGADLAEKGGLGLLVSLILILIYISIRFQFKFAVGAVMALIHDVIITLGFFSVFGLPFDLQVLAALLAVIGYSLNDTIIVADRVRENFRRLRSGTPVELINLSINQTLSRTLVTSGTTMIVVLVMLFAGGEAIRGFSIALTIGIGVGTYSSIYIASAALLVMGVTREDLLVPVKEGKDQDSLP